MNSLEQLRGRLYGWTIEYNKYDVEDSLEIQYPFFVNWQAEDKDGNEIDLVIKVNAIGGGGEAGIDWHLDIMLVKDGDAVKSDCSGFQANLTVDELEELTGQDLVMLGIDEMFTLSFIPFYPSHEPNYAADIECHVHAWEINRDNGYAADCVRHYPCKKCGVAKQPHFVGVVKKKHEEPYVIPWVKCGECGAARIVVKNDFYPVADVIPVGADRRDVQWNHMKQAYLQYQQETGHAV